MLDLLHSLKALADETRLRLAAVLLRHELNVKELTEVLSMGQSRISRHLKILSEAGLTSTRRDGLRVFYSAPMEGPGREMLDFLLTRAGDDDRTAIDLERAGALIDHRAEETRRFFNNIAGDWDRLRREVLGELDLTAEIAARMPDCTLAADLGCGDGAGLIALLPRARRAIGIDASARMLDLAAARLAGMEDRISLRIGRLEHLPLADGEVDFITVCMALHHLSDPRDGLTEAHRSLSGGGQLVIVDFEKHDQEKMRTTYGDHWLGFGTGQLTGWLAKAGFDILDIVRLPAGEGLGVQLISALKPG